TTKTLGCVLSLRYPNGSFPSHKLYYSRTGYFGDDSLSNK
ncbi:9170_t:CDS:1, partial [Funneliformis geosporum]